jgi:alanine racemase
MMADDAGRVESEWMHRRPLSLDVDLSCIHDVTAQLRRELGPDVALLASLKADGYGFGSLAVAPVVERAGADGIALVDRLQAIAIRRAGFKGRILLYAGAPIDEAAARAAEEHDLILSVLDEAEAMALARAARHRVKVAFKIEIGPERLGLLPDDALRLASRILEEKRLKLEVVNSHPTFLPNAPDLVLEEQYKRYRACIERPPLGGRKDILFLFASSKTLRRSRAMNFTAVDPGQLIYDAPPGRRMIRGLTTRLMQARRVTRDFAREHAPFKMDGVTRIGVIPYGRIDGGGRCDAGRAIIRGRIVPFIGVALEYTRLDLTSVPEAQVGDEVMLIGSQAGATIDVGEVLAMRGYPAESDLAIALPSGVRRRYVA